MKWMLSSLIVTVCACAQTPCTQPACIDFDQNGSIDQNDLGVFQRCLGKSGVPYNPKCMEKGTTPLPPYVPPVTPAACTVTVGPDDDWQSIVANAKPGDTVCFKGGSYHGRSGGQNYEGCLSINQSGTTDKPITFRNVPGSLPIFYGGKAYNWADTVQDRDKVFTWAIRVGYVKYDGTLTGVQNIILDSLGAVRAPWEGIEVARSSNVTIRNCQVFENNYQSTNGYKYGINIDAPASNVVVDHCRIYDNGGGISAYETDIHSPEPVGVSNIQVTNNFIYANHRTGNAGNSSGLALRFPERSTISGNVLYDNPDAGINGEGHNFCTVTQNVSINNWQTLPGANKEGIKICVRGGGCNIIAFNISARNGNTGWDVAQGIGDVFINNTVYGNSSWGVMAEGAQSMLFNNLITENSSEAQLAPDGSYQENAYPEMDSLGFSTISDWNLYGSAPVAYSRPSPPIPFPPNSLVKPLTLAGVVLPRQDLHQVIHPEVAFGCSTIEEARTKIFNAYKPTVAEPGLTMARVQDVCNANIPEVKKALDAWIAAYTGSPDLQKQQAVSRYKKLKAELTSYDLSKLTDTQVKGAVK